MTPTRYVNIEIDWRRLLDNLAERNMGIRDVANYTMTPAHTLNELKKRHLTEPPFSVGVKLLNLHYDRCPELQQGLNSTESGYLN